MQIGTGNVSNCRRASANNNNNKKETHPDASIAVSISLADASVALHFGRALLAQGVQVALLVLHAFPSSQSFGND